MHKYIKTYHIRQHWSLIWINILDYKSVCPSMCVHTYLPHKSNFVDKAYTALKHNQNKYFRLQVCGSFCMCVHISFCKSWQLHNHWICLHFPHILCWCWRNSLLFKTKVEGNLTLFLLSKLSKSDLIFTNFLPAHWDI